MTPMRLRRILSTLPPLLLISNLASADAITGRVVDANGDGIPGVDIDFVRLGGGGNPHEANDGTDVNGNFFTTVDPDVYTILFFAPPPPTTTLVTGSLSPVVVSGTVDLGTITLIDGAWVRGTIQNPSGFPVGGVKIDVFDDATGTRLPLKNNTTSAFGTFNLALPIEQRLRFDLLTSTVLGQTLAPERRRLEFPGDRDLGVIQLRAGFHLTGTALRENGSPVAGANVDVTDATTNQTLFTPGDNTTTLGTFDVVVPAGLFDVDVLRPAAQVLVGAGLNNVPVTGATSVGNLVMRNGVFLSGTIRNHRGQPVRGADVDVYEVATGLSLTLGNDNTNPAGFYSVVVPLGLMDVVFAPPGPHAPGAEDPHTNVSVAASMTLDGQFAAMPRGRPSGAPPRPGGSVVPFGKGSPGSAGVPFLQAAGGPAGGTRIWLHSGRPGALAWLSLGRQRDPLAGLPGLSLVRPEIRLPLQLDGQGSGHVDLPAACRARMGQTSDVPYTLFAQLAVRDPGAEGGWALSHLLALGH